VKAVFGGKAPAEVAKAAVAGTKLKDPEARKALVDGGATAVETSTDSMIVLARKIDPLAREVRTFMEDEVEAPVTRAGEKIAQGRWKTYGKTMPPDATFTLRLSYGAVKGFPAEGTQVAPFTTFYGMLDRSLSHGGKAPWALPPRWLEKKGAIDLATPLNFASTNDINSSAEDHRAPALVGSLLRSARDAFMGRAHRPQLPAGAATSRLRRRAGSGSGTRASRGSRSATTPTRRP
jgi:hypothetical protein